jgi:riboflavin kinase / FMN adenylyltransferase
VNVQRVDGAMKLGAPPRSTLVVIGNFDGVHRGHQAVLGSCVEEAAALGVTPVALTFDPHPSEVLGRGKLPVLTRVDRKLELMGRACPGLTVVVEPFTRELAALEAPVFAERLLAGALGARLVLVGENFRFGRGRSGDLAKLRELGVELGFEARAEALRGDDEGAFSSSRVRSALALGRLEEVERQLGHPHAISGLVVPGAGRGRTIGVPTANLSDVREALPPYGVYACLVDRVEPGGARVLGRAAVNIGERPTLDAGFSIEAHVLDLFTDLYGAALRLHFVARLRDERRFDGIEELKAQIGRDLAAARAALESKAPTAGDAWY